jgi:hypothetical protein
VMVIIARMVSSHHAGLKRMKMVIQGSSNICVFS